MFDDETGPGDRLNVAYSSSTVTKGRARGVVFATGLATEIGMIAAALRDKKSKRRPVKRKEDGSASPLRHAQAWTLTFSDMVGRFLGVNVGTPLQRKLSQLAVLLFFVAIVCTIIVLAANFFRPRQEVIIYAVATGVSMLPASLVVVLTITMAAGTKRMVQRHVIVRNLKSLEALGGVTSKFCFVKREKKKGQPSEPIANSFKTFAPTRQVPSPKARCWSASRGCQAVEPTAWARPMNRSTPRLAISA